MWPANLETHLEGDRHRKHMQLPSFQRVPGYQPPAEKNMLQQGIKGMLRKRKDPPTSSPAPIWRAHASFVVTPEEKTKVAALRV